MTDPTLYPSPPADVPLDLTRPSVRYRFQVFLLVVGIVLFVLLYLALVAGSAYMVYWCWKHPFGSSKHEHEHSLISIGAMIFFGMLFLFLFKGLFKGRSTDRSPFVEIKRRDQPDLFEYIDQLCDEVNAPRPVKVFASPDVNAAVIYDLSLINLVLPPRKNLLIGLGLVNSVNVTEFKAVLAHEFGHFSQKSLRLSSYVPEGTSLRRLIWEKDADLPYFDRSTTTIKFEWIIDYMNKQNAAQQRLRRVHYKSLGNILVLQSKIAAAWLEPPPEPGPAVELVPDPTAS